jgi:hypothetical protein
VCKRDCGAKLNCAQEGPLPKTSIYDVSKNKQHSQAALRPELTSRPASPPPLVLITRPTLLIKIPRHMQTMRRISIRPPLFRNKIRTPLRISVDGIIALVAKNALAFRLPVPILVAHALGVFGDELDETAFVGESGRAEVVVGRVDCVVFGVGRRYPEEETVFGCVGCLVVRVDEADVDGPVVGGLAGWLEGGDGEVGGCVDVGEGVFGVGFAWVAWVWRWGAFGWYRDVGRCR